MKFEGARPPIVKSIKQRDLLTTWLRLYARAHALPSLAEYEPDRLGDETPGLLFYANCDLFHCAPGCIEAGDVLGFS